MEVLINGRHTQLTPENIQQLNPTFSLFHGRQFKLQGSDENISLNKLILVVKEAALQPEHDIKEVEEFLRVFKAIENKGYDLPDNQISTENLFIRVITKIKHFFSKAPREQLLKELNQIITKNSSTAQKTVSNDEARVDEINSKDQILGKISTSGEKNSLDIKVILGTRYKDKTPISCTLQEILMAAQERLSNDPEKDIILNDIKSRIETKEFQKNPEKYVDNFIKKTVPPKTHLDMVLLDFLCALIRDRDTNPDFPWNKNNP